MVGRSLTLLPTKSISLKFNIAPILSGIFGSEERFMDTKYISRLKDKEGSVKSSVRSKDLATRERANFVVSSDIMHKLRETSSREQIPMSRIIDTALTNYLTTLNSSMLCASLETGIVMSHLFELLLLISYQSVLTQTIFELVSKYFKNFTYSRCAFKKAPQQSVIMGTKFLLFISDEDNTKFTEFLSAINKQSEGESSDNIKLMLDGNVISF